jgi:hypothetical protein
MVDRKEGELSPFEQAKVLHGLDNIAYVAGFVDGEGCISAYVFNDRFDSRPHFFTRIAVSNVNEDVLHYCREVLGSGKVRPVKRNMTKPSQANSKDTFALIICKRSEVKTALKIIRPYLIVKREVADLVLELISTKTQTKNWFTARDLTIIDEIRVLNKRGRDGKS